MALWKKASMTNLSTPKVGMESHINDHMAIKASLISLAGLNSLSIFVKNGDNDWSRTIWSNSNLDLDAGYLGEPEGTLEGISDDEVDGVINNDSSHNIVEAGWMAEQQSASSFETGAEVYVYHYGNYFPDLQVMELSISDLKSTISDLTARLEALENTGDDD